MDIRNKCKVVYIINQYFFDYFLENRKIIHTKKSEYPNGHSDFFVRIIFMFSKKIIKKYWFIK